jgi:PTH1 family peptidyl-tRNA hydrolase
VTQGITLIVGLGNPGDEYAETRHNAGFRFIDALIEAPGAPLREDRRFLGRFGRMEIDGRELRLLAPLTFMNHSGEAVLRVALYYKIMPAQILVVHDEIDLPAGTVRLKQGGGDGGHNGVYDVIERLGSADFVRLRIGVGRPPVGADTVSYVLRKPPLAEQELIDAAIARARSHIGDIVHGRYQRAMNALHTHGA